MDKNRYLIYCDIMKELKETYELMREYDGLPHDYGNVVLYQSEAHLIQCIGQHTGITVTEASKILKKTKSACSQMVKKLVGKNWVRQERNKQNNREYKLYLTDEHNSQELFDFTDEELKKYIQIQQKMNELIKLDVERSYNYFTTTPQELMEK